MHYTTITEISSIISLKLIDQQILINNEVLQQAIVKMHHTRLKDDTCFIWITSSHKMIMISHNIEKLMTAQLLWSPFLYFFDQFNLWSINCWVKIEKIRKDGFGISFLEYCLNKVSAIILTYIHSIH